MGEQAQRDWQKGLEECTNPEHKHSELFKVLQEERKKGYEDGFKNGKKYAQWDYKYGVWLENLICTAIGIYLGIYIGGVIATGKWIWW